MPSNIEFKARIRDFHAATAIATALSGAPPTIMMQEDVFFRCEHGRLKLRIIDEYQGELIHYERDDLPGPRRSDYTVVSGVNPHAVRRVLADALGETIVVRKTRALYLVGSTRIHLDRVEQLGDFMEVEVVLGDSLDVEPGERIAVDLMRSFGIRESDLVATAYADLLANSDFHSGQS
jgi:predicted adenylyl cyclase CyaB